jgi:MFS family permease
MQPTSTPDAADERLRAFEAEVERHYPWNRRANLVYGLFGTTGLRLINAPTFVPDYMYRLGGSNAAVGAVFLVGGLCRFVGPLLAASVAAHRPLVKPYALRVGTMMRVAVLGIALAGILLPPAWNLVAFFAFYGMFHFFDGMQSVIYNLVMGKIVPLARRGRFIGLRDFLGGLTVAALSLPIGRLLAAVGFPRNYGFTYLVAFALTSVGLACFALTREPAAPWGGPSLGMGRTLRRMPALLRAQHDFARYCVCRALGAAALTATPFFVLYAGRSLDLGGVTLGRLTFGFFLAQTLTNLAWGRIADRYSFRAVYLLAGAAWIAATLLLLAAPHTLALTAVVFVLIGAGQGGFQMAAVNMVFEFGLDADFGHRVATVNMVGELVGAVGPLAGGLLADRVGYPVVFLTSIGFMLAAQTVMARSVRLPREALRPAA